MAIEHEVITFNTENKNTNWSVVVYSIGGKLTTFYTSWGASCDYKWLPEAVNQVSSLLASLFSTRNSVHLIIFIYIQKNQGYPWGLNDWKQLMVTQI